MIQNAMPPHIWAIGDLQGCCAAFDELLQHPLLQPPAELWLVGDLVNRGPASLATLRRVMALQTRAVAVLGNHDLHLLALAAGARPIKRGDTLAEILNAPDAEELITWLRHLPLAHEAHGHLMVHAGVLPGWTTTQTLALAHEVEVVLRGPHWREFLHQMYGDQPDRWNDSLRGVERLRVIVNALTRLRFCTADGVMEFDTKDDGQAAPAGYLPWFKIPGRASADTSIVFGHWSAMGLVQRPGLLGLDTGCVWGRRLTAARLSDRHFVSVDCSGLPGIRRPS